MKALKIVLMAVGGLVALFFIVAAFLPSSYAVERSIEINKAPEVVFEQVADFNNYLKWNPWSKTEPSAKNTIGGTQKEPGASWMWEGDTVGTGSLTIEKLEPHKAIQSKLKFLKPFESEASDSWTFEPTASGTKVVWHNTGELPYPVMRYMGLMMEGMLGPQFEQGLRDLKALSEAQPDPAPMSEAMSNKM
ncbi:MAG: SRPBCC family protein [candidate division KSB1 bacterium]